MPFQLFIAMLLKVGSWQAPGETRAPHLGSSSWNGNSLPGSAAVTRPDSNPYSRTRA